MVLDSIELINYFHPVSNLLGVKTKMPTIGPETIHVEGVISIEIMTSSETVLVDSRSDFG